MIPVIIMVILFMLYCKKSLINLKINTNFVFKDINLTLINIFKNRIKINKAINKFIEEF